MIHYINIHTHQPSGETDCLQITNLIFGQKFELNKKYFYSLGIHPWYLDNKIYFDEFTSISKHQNIIAIGECGLDYQQNILQKAPKSFQKEIFLKQIKIAEELQKPIIIHCVKCFDDLIKIKQENHTSVPWVIHGFSKNKQVAQQLINQGFYLSFGSLIFSSIKNQEALKITPPDKLFLETDEQTRYEIDEIYAQAAKLRNTSLKNIQKQIINNYKQVFKR